MPKFDFLAIGSLTVDIFAKAQVMERVDLSGHATHPNEHLLCIPFGSKATLDELEFFPGGSASNSAVAMSRLGSKVALLSCIGKDSLGKVAVKEVASHGVDTSHVVVSRPLKTGVGLNIASSTGEKSVMVYRGANDGLGPEHLTDSMVKSSRCIFITSLVSKKNFALFLKAVKLARKHKKHVVFCPSITMLRNWLPQLKRSGLSFDVSIFNYEEGSHYSGKGNVKDILRNIPGKVAVVSKDVDGAYAKEGSSFFHVKALPVKVVTTTLGAGDTFSGTFAHFYYSGDSVQQALGKAACIAALKLSKQGAHFHYSKSEALSFLKANLGKIPAERI